MLSRKLQFNVFQLAHRPNFKLKKLFENKNLKNTPPPPKKKKTLKRNK